MISSNISFHRTTHVIIVVGKDEVLREREHIIIVATKCERDDSLQNASHTNLKQHRVFLSLARLDPELRRVGLDNSHNRLAVLIKDYALAAI